MKLEPKALAPLAVLVVALLCTTALVAINPTTEPQEISDRHPMVRVIEVQPVSLRPWVAATGSVVPRVESDLVAEVAGRVIWVSPRFEAGAFFDQGEELLRIEPRDHESGVERARAGVQRAGSQLALASATLGRVETLRARSASSPAKLEEAQSNEGIAAANLRDARAQLSQAELDLDRTRVRAPFSGRVRERTAQPGQFVSRGTSLASIFSTDAAEVRLPVSTDELAFLEVGQADPGKAARLTERGLEAIGMPEPAKRAPRAVLRAPQAGPDAEWQAEIVRAEGVLDDRTRMVNVVARIDNPYSPGSGPPLTMGLFVEAQIEGRELPGMVVLPRSALRPGSQVLVVDEESRLRRREVTVLRSERDQIWIAEGLAEGERVCATPPPVVVEGMHVRVAEEQVAEEMGPALASPAPSTSPEGSAAS